MDMYPIVLCFAVVMPFIAGHRSFNSCPQVPAYSLSQYFNRPILQNGPPQAYMPEIIFDKVWLQVGRLSEVEVI